MYGCEIIEIIVFYVLRSTARRETFPHLMPCV